MLRVWRLRTLSWCCDNVSILFQKHEKSINLGGDTILA
ncbi:hypothetical protein ANDA3_2317 [plant metagenome]|uniref:Uncharacterized protein n=2 Tax=root TaxID=1 RepID=A0A1C3JX49_9BURK|nr:hypothetical protein ODI_01167 [Orrella dioscoreae]SOE49734.1 hypothetical protein ODI_R2277 [Orrella dioscoreae]